MRRAVPGQRPQQVNPVINQMGIVRQELRPELQESRNIPPDMDAQPRGRSKAKGRAVAHPAVHPGNAIVAGPAETLHGLQGQQGKKPVVGLG